MVRCTCSCWVELLTLRQTKAQLWEVSQTTSRVTAPMHLCPAACEVLAVGPCCRVRCGFCLCCPDAAFSVPLCTRWTQPVTQCLRVHSLMSTSAGLGQHPYSGLSREGKLVPPGVAEGGPPSPPPNGGLPALWGPLFPADTSEKGVLLTASTAGWPRAAFHCVQRADSLR